MCKDSIATSSRNLHGAGNPGCTCTRGFLKPAGAGPETAAEGPETRSGGWGGGAETRRGDGRAPETGPGPSEGPEIGQGDPLTRSYFSGRTSTAEALICASGVARVPKPNRRL